MMMCSLLRLLNTLNRRLKMLFAVEREYEWEKSELIESDGCILVDRVFLAFAERVDEVVDGVEPCGIRGGKFTNRPI